MASMISLSFVFILLSSFSSCTTTEIPLTTSVKDITLLDQNSKPVSLALLMKEARAEGLVMFFYPKDNSPLCTKQVQLIQDSLLKFAAKNYLVVGVSKDSPESHLRFSKEFGLTYPLLSDEEGLAHEAFSIGKFFGMSNRSTIIVDKNLKIQHPPYTHNTSASRHIDYALGRISQ